MQITPASLNATFMGFQILFQQGMLGTAPFYTRLAGTRPSTARSETYAFLARIPRFREWIGERLWHNLSSYAQTLINKDWEDGIELDRNDIADDQLGIYSDSVSMLGMQAAKLWDDLLVDAIEAAHKSVIYDGQYFFDTDHPVNLRGSTQVQSNYHVSTPLTPENYALVREKMRSLVGEDGRPLGIVPNKLVVPPQLETAAKKVLEAELIVQSVSGNGTAAVTNVNKGSAECEVIDELGGRPTTWMLICDKFPVKPFYIQIREAPKLVALDQPTADNVVNLKKYRYGADARGNAGYGLWQLAALATAESSLT